MYDQGMAVCEPTTTVMDENIKQMSSSSDGMQKAEERLLRILNKMRGSRPSPLEPSEQMKVDSCHTEQMSYQLQRQNRSLNSIQTQLDELEKLI